MTVMRNGSSRGFSPSNALADTVSDNLQGTHGTNMSISQLQLSEGTNMLLSEENVQHRSKRNEQNIIKWIEREMRKEHTRWVSAE